MITKVPNEKNLVNEINKVRENPQCYIEYLQKYMGYFTGNVLKIPEKNASIQTNEGPAAFQEAIDFLKEQKPLPILARSGLLDKVAKKLRDKMTKEEPAKVKEFDIPTLVKEVGSFQGQFKRIMEFGASTHQEAVINLLVCDGDKNRSQRKALMFDGTKRIGVATGKHDKYKTLSVILCCTKIVDKRGVED